MNYIWIFVWVLLAIFIVVVFLWSMKILFLQKRAWKAFSKKYNLTFEDENLFSSPAVIGMYNDTQVQIYSEEQQADDVRGVRFRTVVEVMKPVSIGFSGVIVSGSLREFVSELELSDDYVPPSELWSGRYLVKTNDSRKIKALMTEERIKSVVRLLKNEKSSFLVIFNKEDLLVRYETADALHDPKRLEKLFLLLLDIMKDYESFSSEAMPKKKKASKAKAKPAPVAAKKVSGKVSIGTKKPADKLDEKESVEQTVADGGDAAVSEDS